MDKAGEQLGPEAGLELLLRDHPLLADGNDLFAHGEDVPLLIDGLDVPLHQVDIALSHRDEMGGDGMAGPGFAHGLDGDAFSFVGMEFHERSSFHRYIIYSIGIGRPRGPRRDFSRHYYNQSPSKRQRRRRQFQKNPPEAAASRGFLVTFSPNRAETSGTSRCRERSHSVWAGGNTPCGAARGPCG